MSKFIVKGAGCPAMVNSVLVNSAYLRQKHPHFGDISRILGRNLRLRNPVKYISGFEINHKPVHPV
jgi:hypothetical protein